VHLEPIESAAKSLICRGASREFKDFVEIMPLIISRSK